MGLPTIQNKIYSKFSALWTTVLLFCHFAVLIQPRSSETVYMGVNMRSDITHLSEYYPVDGNAMCISVTLCNYSDLRHPQVALQRKRVLRAS